MMKLMLLVFTTLALDAQLVLAHPQPACVTPLRIGQVTGLNEPGRFALTDSHAYVINNSSLELVSIEISNPQQMQIVNTLEFPAYPGFHHIVVHQNAAYLTDGFETLQVVDLSNPSQPTLAQTLEFSGFIYRPAIIGNIMYLGESNILDVSDPLNPTPIGSMNLTNPIAGQQHGLTYTTHIELVDLTDPLNPSILTDRDDYTGSNYTIIDIDPTTDTLYAYTNNEIALYDISTPQTPILQYEISLDLDEPDRMPHRRGSLILTKANGGIGGFDTANRNGPLPYDWVIRLYESEHEASRNIQSAGDMLYVVSDHTFGAYSIATNPLVSTNRTSGHTWDVHIQDNLAFTAEEGAGVDIFDVSDSENITRLGMFDQIDSAHAVDSKDNTLYIAAEREGLAVVDISDPTSPTLIDLIDTGRRTQDVHVIDDELFAIDRFFGLLIFDITDPTNPALRSTINLPGWNDRVDFNTDNTIACISSLSYETQILDISDRNNPTVISTITPVNNPTGIFGIQTTTFAGDLLYTSERSNGYRVWDLSDPSNPFLLAHISDMGYNLYDGPQEAFPIVYQVIPRNNQLFVANGNNGLAIYDNADPTNPIFDRYMHTLPNGLGVTASVRRIVMDGDTAYTAVYGGGLKVYDLSSCTPCIADFNLDGQLNFFDVSAFLTAFINNDMAANVDYSCCLSFFDVSTFLTSYSAGCH